MRARPLTIKQANALVLSLHRHHKPVVGHRFSIGAEVNGEIVGAVVVGRPVARGTDPYQVAEVTRLVTNGQKNACSFLYGAASRAASAMGFDSIQTFLLAEETGASLRASGWTCLGQVRRDGVGWNNRNGRRSDQPTVAKVKWEKRLSRNPVTEEEST